MLPIKFWLNPTYSLGDVVWRISRWLLWRPSWIAEWNDFSNSESPCCSNASYQVSARSDLQFGRRCRLKNFKMATMVAILDSGTEERFKQFWISMSLWCLPSSFGSIRLTVWEEMSFEEFQAVYGGYQNVTILSILNLYVAPMPPIKFWLNLTYGLGDVVWRISRWLPSWISERNHFSNSESLCRSDASHQVSAQSDLWFGKRCRLKNFKMATMILEQNDFSNSESLCRSDVSHQVSAQSDLWFGRRCCLKNFKMATMAAILDIGTEPF